MDQMTDVGKLEPVFDMLRGSWSDGDASWAYVMDTDEEGTVTVYNDYTESSEKPTFISISNLVLCKF